MTEGDKAFMQQRSDRLAMCLVRFWDALDLVLQSKVQFASEHHVERWNATIFKTQQVEIREITCNLYYIMKDEVVRQ